MSKNAGLMTKSLTDRLARASVNVVDRCFGVRPGEAVVVVHDPTSRDVAEALWNASRERTENAVMVTVEEDFGAEPPASVAAALAAADVFAISTRRSFTYTEARKVATARGARGATLPGVTAEILARTMAVDLDALEARSREAARLLDESDRAHLTCPRGTDLVLDIDGRQGLFNEVDLSAKHAFGNLPPGESFVAPRTGHGRIAVMSVAPVGLLPEPMMVTVDDGQMVGAEGPYGAELLDVLRVHGPAGTNLADLAIGTNDGAIVTGNVLEDERALGVAHVGFGASDLIGGEVSVPIHNDLVVLDASLDIGGTRLVDKGRWMLDISQGS